MTMPRLLAWRVERSEPPIDGQSAGGVFDVEVIRE